jgi:hypothetical protein
MAVIEELIWTSTLLQTARETGGIEAAQRHYLTAAQTHSFRAVALLNRLVMRVESGVMA